MDYLRLNKVVSPNVSVASLITSNVIYFLLFAGLGRCHGLLGHFRIT